MVTKINENNYVLIYFINNNKTQVHRRAEGAPANRTVAV